jgi:hypothetical protein
VARVPDIVADDKFARLHFDPAERRVLQEAHFRVQLPVGVGELIRVRSRWIRANRELRSTCPLLAATDKRRSEGLSRFCLTHLGLWRDLLAMRATVGAPRASRRRASRWSARRRRWVSRVSVERTAVLFRPPIS